MRRTSLPALFVGERNDYAEAVEPDNLPEAECAKHYAGAIPAVTHLHGLGSARLHSPVRGP